jgi:hypothetical protein
MVGVASSNSETRVKAGGDRYYLPACLLGFAGKAAPQRFYRINCSTEAVQACLYKTQVLYICLTHFNACPAANNKGTYDLYGEEALKSTAEGEHQQQSSGDQLPHD